MSVNNWQCARVVRAFAQRLGFRRGPALALTLVCAAGIVHAAGVASAVPAASQGSLQAGSTPVGQGGVSDADVAAALRAGHLEDTPERRSAVRHVLEMRERLLRQAYADGYQSKPAVVEVVAKATEAAMINALLEDRVKAVQPTDAQVRSRYDELVGKLGKKDYEISVIGVADEAAAKEIIGKLAGGARFGDLAKQKSGLANRTDGGALPRVNLKTPLQDGNTGGLPLALAQSVVTLGEGQYTRKPVLAGNIFYVARLDALRDAQVPTFEATSGELTKVLAAESYEQALDRYLGTLPVAAVAQGTGALAKGGSAATVPN